MRMLIIASFFLLGCLPDLTNPTCTTDEDCWREGETWCHCIDELCFKFDCPKEFSIWVVQNINDANRHVDANEIFFEEEIKDIDEEIEGFVSDMEVTDMSIIGTEDTVRIDAIECVVAEDCKPVGFQEQCVTFTCHNQECITVNLSDVPCISDDLCIKNAVCDAGKCVGEIYSCMECESCGGEIGCNANQGWCVIQDTCIKENVTKTCVLCNPSVDTHSWSLAANGFPCASDGQCVNGECVLGMVYITAGQMYMGCNTAIDFLCEENEKPQKEIEIPAFLIDTTEVTVADYGACMAAFACDAPHQIPLCSTYELGKNNAPINSINWNQAKDYCSYKGKRLCSESEWEKAARGGCEIVEVPCQVFTQVFPWGQSPLPSCDLVAVLKPTQEEAVCYEESECLLDVGSKPLGSSPYGVVDMIGSVAEWIADCYEPNLANVPSDGTPLTKIECISRVLKGGSFLYEFPYLRISARLILMSTIATVSTGIRCCRDVQ